MVPTPDLNACRGAATARGRRATMMAIAAAAIAFAQPAAAEKVERQVAPGDQHRGIVSGHTYKDAVPISGRMVHVPAGAWTAIAHLPITSREGDRLDSAML